MKIGLLSDTHGFLDARVKKYFHACDEVWHAGDIGHAEVLRELEDAGLIRVDRRDIHILDAGRLAAYPG